ncbi:hypothetical protein MMC17_001756 [Xylographa soralifera]|nr:hypothetical protein [Xylographa soralifera]
MADIDDDDTPVNLLALDGGGIRGVSELLILHEIMSRLQFDLKLDKLPLPCDCFHLIGGTNTGGYENPFHLQPEPCLDNLRELSRAYNQDIHPLTLRRFSLVALMLGRLRMSTSEALEQYDAVAQKIFSEGNRRSHLHDGIFIAKTLENEVKRLVDSRKTDGNCSTRMLDPMGEQKMGKTYEVFLTRPYESKTYFRFVCAMPASNMASSRRFRSYRVRNNSSANCQIWEAARATTAAPTFFERIHIVDGQLQEEFIDGVLRCNNPTQEILEEARQVFGRERAIGCVVSIGTGHTGVMSLAKPSALQNIFSTKLIEVLAKIATDCESTATNMATRFENQDDMYFRFSVTHGAGLIAPEEWKRMGEVQTHTKAYLQEPSVSKSVDALVSRLCSPAALGPVGGPLAASS